MTAAIKDYARATLIGTKTYGKGSVQNVHTLSDKSELRVTIAHFFSPKGNEINDVGVTPDIVLQITPDDVADKQGPAVGPSGPGASGTGQLMAEGVRVLASNRKAYQDYFVEETHEAGVALTGTEIKSVRAGSVEPARLVTRMMRNGEMWMMNVHIAAVRTGEP